MKKWRKIMGYSQKDLAEKCQTSHSYIRQLESGCGYPSFSFIKKIADALGIEPYQLLYEENAISDKQTYEKHIEKVKFKLLESIADNIDSAFDELMK
jgi:transcriptional regulator with XRE-family HTH domain